MQDYFFPRCVLTYSLGSYDCRTYYYENSVDSRVVVMEELRAYMVDRFVLSIVNKRQVRPSDFVEYGEESIRLKDEARKDLISLWQKRKKEELTHPYLGERIPLGLLPYTQAMLLARAIRGELEDYPVFLIQ